MKISQAKIISTLAFMILFLYGCNSISFLKNQDFTKGNWLLVKSDGSKGTLFIIDDEKILQDNTNGIKVNHSEKDHYTTCDGQLQLYKDGKLISEQIYLEASYINEKNAIKEAYKKAVMEVINSKEHKEFTRQWDSLKQIPNCYPTIYHTQPEDKDIIWFYKY
jgi:hypothetical protein